MTTQRDTFISELFKFAHKDKDIYFITVDMGAPSLDQWRTELPDQFMSAGISEQHAINFAAGMANEGKKVYVYFMAAWAARCFEQVRYSCAMANNPITILGNGVGLGYAPAGPAHEPNEDIAYMRSILGIEVHTAANNQMVKDLVRLTVEEPKLRYVRLERKQAQELENVYANENITNEFINTGVRTVKDLAYNSNNGQKIGVVSCGYMLGRSLKATEMLQAAGHDCTLVDLWRSTPIVENNLLKCLHDVDYVVTVEEQTLAGGFGSAVAEVLVDNRVKKDVLRIGLPNRYIFENGSRDYHIDNNGLSAEDIYKKVVDFVEG